MTKRKDEQAEWTSESVEVPPVKEYLQAKQKNGKMLNAPEIYQETMRWLKECGCEKAVNIQLVEQYAMSVSRWQQCEEAISEYGFIAKNQKTGGAMDNPYVGMSQQYLKQANNIWDKLFQIVKRNNPEAADSNPKDSLAALLASAGK